MSIHEEKLKKEDLYEEAKVFSATVIRDAQLTELAKSLVNSMLDTISLIGTKGEGRKLLAEKIVTDVKNVLKEVSEL